VCQPRKMALSPSLQMNFKSGPANYKLSACSALLTNIRGVTLGALPILHRL